MSASSSDTSRGSTGRRLDGPAMGQRLHQSTCAFWLGEHCYGIDIAVVGEMVEVDALAAVPMAPVPVRGLFNLRGTPIALVDPTKLLNLPEPPMNDEPRPGRPLNALVLRTETVLVGLLIRRMEMVLTSGKGVFTASEATTPSTRSSSGSWSWPSAVSSRSPSWPPRPSSITSIASSTSIPPRRDGPAQLFDNPIP